MNKSFFASLAVLVVLAVYIAVLFFGFAIGKTWPFVVCPILLAVVVGVAYYVEFVQSSENGK